MIGIHSLVLLSLTFCLAVYRVSANNSWDDLTEDYPNSYGLVDQAELGELLERDKMRAIVDLLQLRKKKDPCNVSLGAAGCNAASAMKATAIKHIINDLGRRKRQLTPHSTS